MKKRQKKSALCNCGKPLDNEFSSRCRRCRSDYQRTYYQAHKEKQKQYQREYRDRHLNHKSTMKKRSKVAIETKVPRQVEWTHTNLMAMPVGQFLSVIDEMLINGKRPLGVRL